MKKIFAFIVVAMATMVSGINSNAQETRNDSQWKEVQKVDIPAGQTVHEGITKNGNPKFWFEFKNIGKVNVSPGSAAKYKKGEVTLILVKWQHIENGTFRYSIRQKSKAGKVTPDVDLTKIF
jgi:hypothetical protein